LAAKDGVYTQFILVTVWFFHCWDKHYGEVRFRTDWNYKIFYACAE